MQTLSIQQNIKNFIEQQILRDSNSKIDQSTPLLELGILDSLAMTELVVFIETTYNVSIPMEEITAKNFGNLRLLNAFVTKLKSEDANAAA